MTMLKARRTKHQIIMCGRVRCRGEGTVFGRVITMFSVDGDGPAFDLLGTMSLKEDKEGVYYAERPFISYARSGGDPYQRRPERKVRDQESRTLHGPFSVEQLSTDPVRCRCRRCDWDSWVTPDVLA
jgi:hypothetical protein